MALKLWSEVDERWQRAVYRRLGERFTRLLARVEAAERVAPTEPCEEKLAVMAGSAVQMVREAEACAAALAELGLRPVGTEAESALERAELSARLIRAGGAAKKKRPRRRRGRRWKVPR